MPRRAPKLSSSPPPTSATPISPAPLLSVAATKKLKLYTEQLKAGTPFVQHSRPTPEEAEEVCKLLASVHGMPTRPEKLVDREDAPAGCGQVPSVLDAVVRTCLSANTTSKNSTAAKQSMDSIYGRADYRAVLDGGQPKLEDAIRCGGLAGNKSKAIIRILERCEQRNVEKGGKKGEGELSLDYLHDFSDEDAMKELLSFDSIGIKTASCVLLFCLGRDSFAVDTHVWRISQSLGWLPTTGSVYLADPDSKSSFTRKTQTSNGPSRDQTFYHLDARLPSHLKYSLHSLLVRHGRGCRKCAANGVTTQSFVDTCPIDHLVRRKGKKSAKGRGKAVEIEEEDEDEEVAVKDEEGQVVGTASTKGGKAFVHAAADKTFKPEELGVAAHDAVKLEDDLPLAGAAETPSRRSTRARAGAKRVKYEDEGSAAEDDEYEEKEEEEEVKPAKRARTTAPRESALTKGSKATKRGGAAAGGAKAGGARAGGGEKKADHSVDRDEAEMSGRGWQEGEMHGLPA